MRKFSKLLLFIVFTIHSLAANEVTRYAPVDDLETRHFNQSIENGLTESLSNYLGEHPFLVSVSSKLRRALKYKVIVDEQIVSVPQTAKPIKKLKREDNDNGQPLANLSDDFFKLDQNPIKQQNNNLSVQNINDPQSGSGIADDGLPLPGTPFVDDYSQNEEIRIAREKLAKAEETQRLISQVQNQEAQQKLNVLKQYIERQNKLIVDLQEAYDTIPQEVNNSNQSEQQSINNKVIQTTRTELVSDTVEILQISLKAWVPNYLKQNKVEFVRDLIEEKANLNYVRGDKLDLIATTFPGKNNQDTANDIDSSTETNNLTPTTMPEFSTGALIDKILENPYDYLWWLIPLLLLLLILWLIFRKRKRNHYPKVYSQPYEDDSQHSPNYLPEQQNIHALADQRNDNSAEKASDTPTDVKVEVLNDEITSMVILGDNLLKNTFSNSPNEKLLYSAGLQKILGKKVFDKFANQNFSEDDRKTMFTIQNQIDTMGIEERYQLSKQIYELLIQEKNKSTVSLNKDKPFEFINNLSDKQILYLLSKENLQTKALVLSQMNAEKAAKIMSEFDQSEQGQIAIQMGQLQNLPLESYRSMANRLARLSIEIPDLNEINIDGDEVLIRALEEMDMAGESTVLNSLRIQNPEQYYRIKKIYINFSEITRVPIDVLKNLLRELEKEPLAVALYEEDDSVREYIFSAMPNRAKEIVKQYLKTLNVPSTAEMLEAKKIITRKVRKLLKAGAVQLLPEEESIDVGDNIQSNNQAQSDELLQNNPLQESETVNQKPLDRHLNPSNPTFDSDFFTNPPDLENNK